MLVAGLSLGSITADAVQRAIDADPERPDPDQLTFIVSGDASRITPVSTGIGAFLPEGFRIPLLGWTVTRPEDDSEYNTVVVVGEYDFTADFPDRPWNLLALANSLVGFAYSHGPSALTDPDDVPEEDITVTTNEKGATTTTYLVPQPTLPLLKPFSGVAPRVVEAANNALKPIVDRGYSRNDVENGDRMPYLQPHQRPAATCQGAQGNRVIQGDSQQDRAAPSGTRDQHPRRKSRTHGDTFAAAPRSDAQLASATRSEPGGRRGAS